MRLGYTRDGLRAMMAYSGVDDTINYIHTAGAYNPTVTAEGDRLSDVYQRYTPTPGEQFGGDFMIAEQYFDTISDPEIREQARRAYQAEVEADDWARQRMQEDAYRTAVSALEDWAQNSSPTDLANTRFSDLFSLADRDALGPSKVAALREEFDRIRRGQEPETDPALFGALYEMYEMDPGSFAAVDLVNDPNYRGRLSNADLREFQIMQARVGGEAVEAAGQQITPTPPSDLRDAAGSILGAIPDTEVRGRVELALSNYDIAYQRAHASEVALALYYIETGEWPMPQRAPPPGNPAAPPLRLDVPPPRTGPYGPGDALGGMAQ